MELGFTGGVALIVLLGVGGQVLGRVTRVPSIIVLLLLGLLVGPVLGWLHPEAIFGDILFPLVTMAVSLLLFEESLKLDLGRLGGGARRPVIGLVTLGAVLTGVGASVAAWAILDLTPARAAVIGAIVIVSGPTVVGPLLAIIRPKQPLESVLAFEGIFIDPIGATVALGAVHVALHGDPPRLGLTSLAGIVSGLLGAALYVVVVRSGWVPAPVQVALAVAVALAAFAGAEAVRDEAGLFATTAMGVALANQRFVPVGALHEFGSHVGLLIVGSLFIVLAALVDLDALLHYLPVTLVVVALLALVVRPVAAWLSTARSVLTGRERAMVAWMAPRGVVAASTASVFTIRFDQAGTPFPQLVPVVFGIVLTTAVLYGLTGPLVARALGVRGSDAVALDEEGAPLVAG
ncbi:cation:proton antiporter [Cellulomonas sp.]|uniref:cation:proton antiporter domain-containing protein n=1 Tax=Cellulomonas sp. TaxID=40001 RepID=UPI001B0A2C64|nr:cation:proton antiporter [Cellulomonas sp.]MBO9554890.1 cation:proton antiporter [Cellulomonas sp.]